MKIWAWGANTNAQCGLGYCSEQVSTPTLVPVQFKCPKNPNKIRTFADYPDILPLKVEGGASETVLLVENIPFTEPFEWKPNFVILPYPKMRDISCGWDFSLYLSNEGIIYSRGSNSHCQLGRVLPEGSKSDKQWDRNKFPEDPTDQSVGLDLAQVAAGLRHGAVISSHLELLVWGNNSQNQIGPSTRPGPDEPISQKIIPSPREATVLDFPAGFHTGFTQVACGKDFTIACDQEGWLYGCGLNKFGCLCHAPQDVKGFQGFASIYEKIPNRSFPGNIADLKCGWGHCLALLDTGKVVTWGRNDFGQLGRDSCNPKFDVEPKPIVLPESIVSIACGSEHSLALGESGAVYAWGWNEHDNCGVPNRQFGNVTTDSIRYPIRVPFPEQVKVEVIGCGAGTSFAVSL